MSVTYYVYLAIAIALLCFPRGWLRFGVRVTPKPPRKVNQHKVERDPYDRSPKPLQEMAKSRNWVDFFRAAAGGYAVMLVAQQWTSDIDAAPTGWVLAAAGATWAVGAIVQMVRLEGRLGLFAPVFFLQGTRGRRDGQRDRVHRDVRGLGLVAGSSRVWGIAVCSGCHHAVSRAYDQRTPNR